MKSAPLLSRQGGDEQSGIRRSIELACALASFKILILHTCAIYQDVLPQESTAVYFRYEVSPISVVYEEIQASLYKLIISLLSIIGGIFAVFGIINGVILQISSCLKSSENKIGLWDWFSFTYLEQRDSKEALLVSNSRHPFLLVFRAFRAENSTGNDKMQQIAPKKLTRITTCHRLLDATTCSCIY